MKRIILLLFSGIMLNGLHAQQTVSGKINDSQQTPVVGANVYILNSYDGTSTGPDGNFSFKTDVKGPQVLVASMVGFKELRLPVDLDTLCYPLWFTMKEDQQNLHELVITAGVFEASDEKKSVALKPIDIVTTAGATADIPGVMNTMPGTQAVGEKGRLFVRGGDDTETRNFIDGVLVDNMYNLAPDNIPSRMRFSPFLFSGTSFSTGGYSAEYGQALSGTLVMKSDDTPVQSQTDLSLMTVGGSVARTQKWKGGSVFGETYYVNLRPYFALVPQERTWEKAPESWQNNFMLRQETGKYGKLKVFYSNEFSRMGIQQPSMIDLSQNLMTRLRNTYHYLNINYNFNAGKNWFFFYGMSGTWSFDTTSIEILSIGHQQNSLHSKFTANFDPGARFALRFGTDQYQFSYRENLYWSPGNNRYSGSTRDWIPALFAESDIYFSPKFLGRLGVRTEYSSLSQKLILAPRLSFAYKTGNNSQVSLAAGKYNQRPPAEYLVIRHDLKDECAVHYIINWQVVRDDRTFRLEAYRKTYSGLVRFDSLFQYNPMEYSNNGHGYANGVDIFWRDSRTIHNGDYWISYTLIDTRRRYRNFPVESVPTFVSTHNLSIVYKQFFSALRSQLGVTYSLASARPYNDPNSDRFNGGRTPVFLDLSMNWSFLIRTNIILHLSATNVLGRDNIFGYQYSLVPDSHGVYERIPVKQGARRFIFAGLFITLSKDNKTNQIRNL